MTKVGKAVSIFSSGLNCCQSVLGAFCEDLGLTEEIALKLATPFGGGIISRGDLCGAVSGALMVIGLTYGRTTGTDSKGKEKTYAIAAEFIKKFEEKNKTIACRELLGYDISLESDRQHVADKNLFNTLCTQFVKDAAEILEEML